jgi:phospholipase/carboxylesterase
MWRSLVIVSFLLASAACDSGAPVRDAQVAPPNPAAPATSVPAVRPTLAAGLHFVELRTGGAAASDKLPMIIALHGLGDSAASFVQLFEGFDVPARIVALQAPDAYGPGFAWFPFSRGGLDEPGLAIGLSRAAQAAGSAIVELSRSRPTLGRPIVTGFSQGGMTSFALALQHGDTISEAYPIAGLLPTPMYPTSPDDRKGRPRIVALHGDADTRVPYALGRETVGRFAAAGYDATLESFSNVEHDISRELRARLFELLRGACERARAQSAGAPPPPSAASSRR